MKILGLFMAFALSFQVHGSSLLAPFKTKTQKPLTYQGRQVKAAEMVGILKKQKSKFGMRLTRSDWEGVYTFKFTADESGENYTLKVPLLSSDSFPGSPVKDFPNVLLQMPVGVVVGDNSYATSMLPFIVTRGKDETSDIYVGLEDYGFFYYRMNVGKDGTGVIYLVESLSGEAKEHKIGTLALQSFYKKADLNLEVSSYYFELKGEDGKILSSKFEKCKQAYKGEMGFVKFPSMIATTPAGYAWQNKASDGDKCDVYFAGSPVGPRADKLKVEGPTLFGCVTEDDGDDNTVDTYCSFAVASELQFQGAPTENNMVMKLYLSRVYQYEVAASVNLVKR